MYSVIFSSKQQASSCKCFKILFYLLAMDHHLVVLTGGKRIVDDINVMQLHCPTLMLMSKIWPYMENVVLLLCKPCTTGNFRDLADIMLKLASDDGEFALSYAQAYKIEQYMELHHTNNNPM